MRGGGPPLGAATIALVALLVAGLTACSGSSRRAPDLAYGPVAEHTVPLGAFLGSGSKGTRARPGFAAFLGVGPRVGHTYLPGYTWEAVEGQDSILDPWTAWRRAKTDR